MPAIRVVLDQDHERTGRQVVGTKPYAHTAQDWTIDVLDHGMQSGASSLMVMIPFQIEGVDAVLMAETSLQCFMQAATALASARHEEVERPGWAVLSPAARDLLRPRFVEGLRRVFRDASTEQLTEAAELVLDGFGAGAPPDLAGEQP